MQEGFTLLPILHVYGLHVALRRSQRAEHVKVTVVVKDEDGGHVREAMTTGPAAG